ncbi:MULTISPECIES: hypothetical protein [Shewanella]|uniref:Uncharacterized protein n=1 Tax=Shewanella metallivivens TaxID=2872342 RepID=A0ABT5TQB9_9GAMM|nr:hypothetical protein [Shewanella metallivivens]MDD8060807.1 hypothetical protein [Shewanella metallivivens]
MWFKSFAAFVWGLLLAVCLALLLFRLLPFAADTKLFVGMMLGFCLWVAVMIYCYSRNNAKAASMVCGKWFVVSAIANVLLFYIPVY